MGGNGAQAVVIHFFPLRMNAHRCNVFGAASKSSPASFNMLVIINAPHADLYMGAPVDVDISNVFGVEYAWNVVLRGTPKALQWQSFEKIISNAALSKVVVAHTSKLT